ncbi:MAG: hypothetical protein ABI668_01785 [Sphingorhabdus sp.]
MIKKLLVALALAAALPSVASAEYQFDPKDLPENFECEPDASVKKCDDDREHEAWWNVYGERYDRWHHELLFNLNIYFGAYDKSDLTDASSYSDGWSPEANGAETPNLLDAVYSVALRRFGGGWGFAVQIACPDERSMEAGECGPKLRMVSFRKRDGIDPQLAAAEDDSLPTTKEEVAAKIRVIAKWEQADLQMCRGAIDQLLALPAQKGTPIWHPNYVRGLRGKPLRGKPSDEIIVTADGSGVYVRARSEQDPFDPHMGVGGATVVYSQWNGGDGREWALKMEKTAKPCLKPASAPAPWDKIVAADANVEGK